MNLTPEIKAQLAEQKKQCIFCKIIAKEIQSKVVFEDKLTLATLDIHPARKGHTLYFLKEHYPIMPYIPQEEFMHLFGNLPALCKAIMQATVSTAVNVFIANGGPAGQQAPHFLMHVIPRDNDDGFNHFQFKKGEALDQKGQGLLAHHLPNRINAHLAQHPAAWHSGKGNVPAYLSSVYGEAVVLYEDEKALCVVALEQAAPGHLIIYSKTREKQFELLDAEDAAHLFYVASFAAGVVFEGLGAHGTNIIVKSGVTADNPTGRLAIHVLPRQQGDSLQSLHWQPKQPSYNLDAIAKDIKNESWIVGQKNTAPQVGSVAQMQIPQKKIISAPQRSLSAKDLIEKAIEEVKK